MDHVSVIKTNSPSITIYSSPSIRTLGVRLPRPLQEGFESASQRQAVEQNLPTMTARVQLQWQSPRPGPTPTLMMMMTPRFGASAGAESAANISLIASSPSPSGATNLGTNLGTKINLLGRFKPPSGDPSSVPRLTGACTIQACSSGLVSPCSKVRRNLLGLCDSVCHQVPGCRLRGVHK